MDSAGPFADAYYRAIRGTLSPFEGVSGGFSIAQLTGNAGDNADAANDNLGITVFGLDGNINLGIFEITGEFATSSVDAGIQFPVEDVEDRRLLR